MTEDELSKLADEASSLLRQASWCYRNASWPPSADMAKLADLLRRMEEAVGKSPVPSGHGG